MSLLNDALRAAEQRQGQPNVSAAYVGRVHRQSASHRWLVPVMALLLLILAAIAVYGFFFRTSVTEIQVVGPAASQESEPNPNPNFEAMLAANSTERATQEEAPVAESMSPKPEVSSPEPQSESKIANDSPVAPTPTIERQTSQSKSPAVKQIRETAETIDLRISRQLSRLLRAGEFRAAEQQLAEVVSNQAAPVSRGVYARAMLLQESPGRALPWVSGDEAQDYPELRLLRARALLSMGRSNEAVKALSQDIPPVADNVEYRITLATLMQQAGQNVEAARHWSALIALDDSQPTWWVGLAIALEAGGQAAGALKAYTQAAQLPGLSPSLADYVRNRMTLLQAG